MEKTRFLTRLYLDPSLGISGQSFITVAFTESQTVQAVAQAACEKLSRKGTQLDASQLTLAATSASNASGDEVLDPSDSPFRFRAQLAQDQDFRLSLCWRSPPETKAASSSSFFSDVRKGSGRSTASGASGGSMRLAGGVRAVLGRRRIRSNDLPDLESDSSLLESAGLTPRQRRSQSGSSSASFHIKRSISTDSVDSLADRPLSLLTRSPSEEDVSFGELIRSPMSDDAPADRSGTPPIYTDKRPLEICISPDLDTGLERIQVMTKPQQTTTALVHSACMAINRDSAATLTASAVMLAYELDGEIHAVNINDRPLDIFRDVGLMAGFCFLLRPRPSEPVDLASPTLVPTLADFEEWQSSFKALLSSPIGEVHFRAFLETELSLENLLFYNAVGDYVRAWESTSPERRRQRAARIFERYVRQGAVNEVNISSSLRSSIPPALDAARVDLFDEASQEIYQVMERDSFRRFVQSPAMAALRIRIDNRAAAAADDKKKRQGILLSTVDFLRGRSGSNESSDSTSAAAATLSPSADPISLLVGSPTPVPSVVRMFVDPAIDPTREYVMVNRTDQDTLTTLVQKVADILSKSPSVERLDWKMLSVTARWDVDSWKLVVGPAVK